MLHRAIGVDYVGCEWCVDWQAHGAERLSAFFCGTDFVVSHRRILAGLLEAGQIMRRRFDLRDTQV